MSDAIDKKVEQYEERYRVERDERWADYVDRPLGAPVPDMRGDPKLFEQGIDAETQEALREAAMSGRALELARERERVEREALLREIQASIRAEEESRVQLGTQSYEAEYLERLRRVKQVMEEEYKRLREDEAAAENYSRQGRFELASRLFAKVDMRRRYIERLMTALHGPLREPEAFPTHEEVLREQLLKEQERLKGTGYERGAYDHLREDRLSEQERRWLIEGDWSRG